MENMNDIVKLAVDYVHGSVKDFSADDASEVLYNAMVEANNGKTYLDIRDVRSGKCGELFTIIEQILNVTVAEGLKGDEFFMQFVEYRNVAEGDQEKFFVEDNTLFVMSEVADGTQALRRQRLGGMTETTIPTKTKGIRIYEELNRILAGRADLNSLIRKVTETVKKQMLDEIYAVWSDISSDDLGKTYYPVAGSYSEDALLDLIQHVEAAADGKPAVIIGTKKAIRKLSTSIVADAAKNDYYNSGYAGKFNGTAVICVPQRHKVGSTDFIMDDDKLTIVAGADKPIKVVREGNPLILMDTSAANADLTQNYLYLEKWGIGVLLHTNTGMGVYEMTA